MVDQKVRHIAHNISRQIQPSLLEQTTGREFLDPPSSGADHFQEAMASPWLDRAQMRATGIEAIQHHVSRMFGLNVEQLTQKSKERAVSVPRQIAMYLAKQLTDASLTEIGHQFGDKHHTTVMHSIARIHEQRRTDPSVDHAINKLLKTLGHSTPEGAAIPQKSRKAGSRNRQQNGAMKS